jgi:hypothetical protein
MASAWDAAQTYGKELMTKLVVDYIMSMRDNGLLKQVLMSEFKLDETTVHNVLVLVSTEMCSTFEDAIDPVE